LTYPYEPPGNEGVYIYSITVDELKINVVFKNRKLKYSDSASSLVNHWICGGYQFGGTFFGAESYSKNRGFKILGFSIGTALAVLAGFIDLYVTVMSND
jgi:hypothetical protein